MPDAPVAGFHLVRFGTAADQQYLLGEFLPTYDQLIINANMVAHMPAALASFLTIRANNKPYFIDPQTHAFQHDMSFIESDSGEIKKSLQKLIQGYGNPIKSSVIDDHRHLSPNDFSNKNILEGFCKRVLRFQMEAISTEANQSDSAKYYKYLNKVKGIRKTFTPTLLVAPYFYLTANTLNKWLAVNINCAKSSKKIAKEFKKPLGVQIVLSQDLLTNTSKMEELINAYAEIEPDVFLIWIDAFSEQKASEQELEAFINLYSRLGEIAPIVNLYGGFLSIALSRCNILENVIGVSHGLEYGESRGVVPVGGGIPTAKFYFPALYHRLLFRDALRLVREVGGFKSVVDFHDKICNCKVCKEVVKKNPESDFQEFGKTKPVRFQRGGQSVAMSYPLPETKEKTVKHYMWCKKREYQTKYSCDEIIDALGVIKGDAENVLDPDVFMHCEIWMNILKSQQAKV